MRTRPTNQGFTLIELLVVITIIVVLLALLVPAMDKAIYQAELAVCGANLHATGAGVISYAYDHKRAYPYRPGLHDTTLNWHPMWIRSTFNLEHDDRPALRGYVTINKLFNDPMSPGEVNFDDTTASLDTHMYASYGIWWDWQYFAGSAGQTGQGIGAQSRMSRVGSRWSWTDPAAQGGKRRQFRILASDHDRIHQGELSLNSHPDRDGKLSATVYQDHPAAGISTVGAVKQTLSFWSLNGDGQRGKTDMNTAYDDGSVLRTVDIGWEDWRTEEKVVQVPTSTDADRYAQFYVQVPVR